MNQIEDAVSQLLIDIRFTGLTYAEIEQRLSIILTMIEDFRHGQPN